MAPSEDDVRDWVDFMNILLGGATVGQRYVYFDGSIIPVDAERIDLEGFHSAHALRVVPQVEALHDPAIIQSLLINPIYWKETALKGYD
jgi:hypothetical protein